MGLNDLSYGFPNVAIDRSLKNVEYNSFFMLQMIFSNGLDKSRQTNSLKKLKPW